MSLFPSWFQSWFFPCATGLAWFMWLAPRLWLGADRRVARDRLVTRHDTTTLAATTTSTTTTTSSAHNPASLVTLATAARDAARAMRSGHVAGVALSRALNAHCHQSTTMVSLAADLDRALPISGAFEAALARIHRSARDEARFVSLLATGTIDAYLAPSILERTADVLDDLAARDADVCIAAAHAALTVRFLTLLPLGVAALAWITSGELRSSWHHPAVVVPCTVGLALHVAGRLVVRRIVSSVTTAAREPDGASSRLADTLAAALAAGLSPAAACARLDLDPHCGRAARSAAAAVRAGAPLVAALDELAADARTADVADTLLSAAHNGSGAADAAVRLADQSRRRRAEQTRAAVAALPGRLSVPVTLFILPSFLVGVLVPVVATGARLS